MCVGSIDSLAVKAVQKPKGSPIKLCSETIALVPLHSLYGGSHYLSRIKRSREIDSMTESTCLRVLPFVVYSMHFMPFAERSPYLPTHLICAFVTHIKQLECLHHIDD